MAPGISTSVPVDDVIVTLSPAAVIPRLVGSAVPPPPEGRFLTAEASNLASSSSVSRAVFISSAV